MRPDELLGVNESLKKELAGLNINQRKIFDLKDYISEQKENFHKSASQLSESRSNALDGMAEEINEKLRHLSMEEARFSCEMSRRAPDLRVI